MEINEIATRADLQQVKAEILAALGEAKNETGKASQKWLKSAEVMEMLGLSASGLQNLRIKGAIPHSKLGGVYYYPYAGILAILEANKKDASV